MNNRELGDEGTRYESEPASDSSATAQTRHSGVVVRVVERPGAVSIHAVWATSEAIARVDRLSGETVVDASGGSPAARRRLRRIVFEHAAAQCASTVRDGLDEHEVPQVSEDRNAWTSMQVLAYSTDGYWYPPFPQSGAAGEWVRFVTLAAEFNEMLHDPDGAATTPHPTPPRGEQSSADPATPDQPGSAAE